MAEIDYDLISHDDDRLAVLKLAAESAQRAASEFAQTMQRISDVFQQTTEE